MKLKKHLFKKVKSTNDTALRLIKSGYQKGIVLSEYQSKGRGQRENKWISKKGNLFVTVFFDISKKMSIKKIVNLNLSIIKKIISKRTKLIAIVKKPNDILLDKKKVCGILQEVLTFNDKFFLIVGIGINTYFAPEIGKTKTSCLKNYSKIKINNNKILIDIKKIYEKIIVDVKHNNFSLIKKKYKWTI